MKLFLDQNLSRRLVGRLSNEYPGSGHVTEVGLDIASDRAIWEYAGERDYVIVSKDTDFRQLAFLYGPPPKVVWLRVGNVSTSVIEGCPDPGRGEDARGQAQALDGRRSLEPGHAFGRRSGRRLHLRRRDAPVACSARSTAATENTQWPAPGMIGRTGELPLRTARFSDTGCSPQRWASSSVVSVSRPPSWVMSMSRCVAVS